MIATLDTPVTDKELASFYGEEASEYQVADAISRHTRAFDADDLIEAAAANSISLLASLQSGNAAEFFRTFQTVRKALIADRASYEVFGRHGVVKAAEVV